MFDSINEFFRNFLWSIVSGILDWLYSSNTDLIQPATLVNWSNSITIRELAVKIILPISASWIILLSIFGILKIMTNSKEKNYYDFVKGVLLSCIISGSFWYVAPFFYSKIAEMSIPLAETLSSNIAQMSSSTSNFKYFFDNNGSLVRLDESTGTYYDGNNPYRLKESNKVPNSVIAIVRTDSGVLNGYENIFNSNCEGIGVCSLEGFKSSLKEVSTPVQNLEYSKLDILIFETVVRSANSNNMDIDKFINDYGVAKINKVHFNYNAKQACSGIFCNSTYFYNLNELFTAVIGIIVLIFLFNITIQMISRSLIYSWDMITLPFVSASLVAGNKNRLENHLKEMLGLLALNLIQLWSFYLCMIFVQFAMEFSDNWLFGLACLCAGFYFASGVPQRVMAMFGVQDQSLNMFNLMMNTTSQMTARGAIIGGISLLGGTFSTVKSVGQGVASMFSGNNKEGGIKSVYSSNSSSQIATNSNATSFNATSGVSSGESQNDNVYNSHDSNSKNMSNSNTTGINAGSNTASINRDNADQTNNFNNNGNNSNGTSMSNNCFDTSYNSVDNDYSQTFNDINDDDFKFDLDDWMDDINE